MSDVIILVIELVVKYQFEKQCWWKKIMEINFKIIIHIIVIESNRQMVLPVIAHTGEHCFKEKTCTMLLLLTFENPNN